MTDFLMPSLGADMEDGTLVERLVHVGDAVKRGDVVAVVETDKGAIEIEIFETGIISEILVQVGTKVPVGTPLARLEGRATSPTSAQPPATAAPSPPAPPLASMVLKDAPRGRVTPAARRRARELGVAVDSVTGTGVGGAVSLADVERAIGLSAPSRPGFDPASMRRAIAATMSRSKREIPHYYLSETVDLTRATAWLQVANADRGPEARLLPAVLFLKAVTIALAKVPDLNGHWMDVAFRKADGIHVGWAIALRGGGLVAPAIHHADRASLDDLMVMLKDVIQRARSGGLRSSELSDPTITVTSLGDRGVDSVAPIIFSPQVAIVGFGRVSHRPLVVDGAIVACPSVTATLAADHRVSDGHRGGLYLRDINRVLQEPAKL